MKPALLAEILRDPALVAERCVRLREALPHANVSQMVSLQPSLLLEVSRARSFPDECLMWWMGGLEDGVSDASEAQAHC